MNQCGEAAFICHVDVCLGINQRSDTCSVAFTGTRRYTQCSLSLLVFSVHVCFRIEQQRGTAATLSVFINFISPIIVSTNVSTGSWPILPVLEK